MASPQGARVMPVFKEKKGKAELAREAATQKQREERNGEIKKLTATYFVCACVGMVLILVGVTSTSWYTYANTNDSLTTSGDKVFYQQEWGMGIKGVTIKTQYCQPGTSDCLPDLDLHLYFDNTKNTGFLWPDRYLSVVDKANSAGFNLVVLVSLTVVASFSCVVVTLVGLCCQLPNWLAWGSVLFNFLAGCMGGLGTVLFMMDTGDIRDLLKADSVVAQTEPALAMDWAVYISFAGNALPILATAPLAQATWWATGGGLNDLNEKVLKERAARIKQYREDLTNSTYERESYPIDNAPGGARGVGWTKEVLTVPANPLFELASGDGKVLNPHTELIVNGGKKSDQGVEGRNSRMSGTSTSLIPSKGALVGIGKTPTGADTMSATSFGGSQTLKGFETTSSLAKITQLKDSVPPCESPLFGMREEMMEADNAQMRQTRLGGGVLLPKPDADVGMERSPAHLKMSSTMAMLPDEFGNTAPIEVFGETAPIDSVKAVERKRNVTRVPVADRPDIEGFVDSSNTRKKKNDRDKFSYETQKVVVNNTTR